MIRVILVLALGFSGIFLAVALNPPSPATTPAIAPCNCPGEPQ